MTDSLMPHEDIANENELRLAYQYVESVAHTADDHVGHRWNGWALREAFLAGMHAAKSSKPQN
jgi:hypothetical protein